MTAWLTGLITRRDLVLYSIGFAIGFLIMAELPTCRRIVSTTVERTR
jgi:hypothetical protein